MTFISKFNDSGKSYKVLEQIYSINSISKDKKSKKKNSEIPKGSAFLVILKLRLGYPIWNDDKFKKRRSHKIYLFNYICIA